MPGAKLPTFLAITLGDHDGIGPEIISKSLCNWESSSCRSPIVIGSESIVRRAWDRWGDGSHLETIEDLSKAALEKRFVASKYVYDPLMSAPAEESLLPEQTYIRVAARGCLDGIFDAMVTAPICKEAMYARGFRHPGHTEYLAYLTGAQQVVMGFVAPTLRVSLATVHIPLAQVPLALSPESLLSTIRVSHRAMREWFAIPDPRLAVCGLNPHAGENGHIGREEQDWIIDAIKEARREQLNVVGPVPADTVFVRAIKGEFDLVVALYHDQGLIPVKVLSFGESVNVTLGLPIVRTSVDHGVAYDIAGKGIADCSSMSASIRLAMQLCEARDRMADQDPLLAV